MRVRSEATIREHRRVAGELGRTGGAEACDQLGNVYKLALGVGDRVGLSVRAQCGLRRQEPRHGRQ